MMKLITDLFNTIVETSKERIKNPFIGAFILAWIVMNWKGIFYFLFSDASVEERLLIVDLKYTSWSNGLWYPLSIAFFYIVLLPYLMWGLEELGILSTKGRKENIYDQLMFDIEKKQDLAEEEAKLEEIKAGYREKSDLNDKIERLEVQLDQRDLTIESLRKEIEKNNNVKLENSVSRSTSKSGSIKTQLSERNKRYDRDFKEFMDDEEMVRYFYDIGQSIIRERNFPVKVSENVKQKYLYNFIIEERFDESDERTGFYFTEKGSYFLNQFLISVYNANGG